MATKPDDPSLVPGTYTVEEEVCPQIVLRPSQGHYDVGVYTHINKNIVPGVVVQAFSPSNREAQASLVYRECRLARAT